MEGEKFTIFEVWYYFDWQLTTLQTNKITHLFWQNISRVFWCFLDRASLW